MEITVPPKKEDRKQIKKGKGPNTKRNEPKGEKKREKQKRGSTSKDFLHKRARECVRSVLRMYSEYCVVTKGWRGDNEWTITPKILLGKSMKISLTTLDL